MYIPQGKGNKQFYAKLCIDVFTSSNTGEGEGLPGILKQEGVLKEINQNLAYETSYTNKESHKPRMQHTLAPYSDTSMYAPSEILIPRVWKKVNVSSPKILGKEYFGNVTF